MVNQFHTIGDAVYRMGGKMEGCINICDVFEINNQCVTLCEVNLHRVGSILNSSYIFLCGHIYSSWADLILRPGCGFLIKSEENNRSDAYGSKDDRLLTRQSTDKHTACIPGC